jgi:hypothetical protein
MGTVNDRRRSLNITKPLARPPLAETLELARAHTCAFYGVGGRYVVEVATENFR